jgi:hypothetical protein
VALYLGATGRAADLMERSRNVYENKAKWKISPLPWGEGGPARRLYQPRWDG